jgi:hypothetical protein
MKFFKKLKNAMKKNIENVTVCPYTVLVINVYS